MAERGSNGVNAMLCDLSIPALEWSRYCFLSPSGTVTISGYFCISQPVGAPVQADGTHWSYTGSITAATPITLLAALGLSALPASSLGICGFVGQISGAVAFCAASADGLTVPSAISTDMVANVGRYPQIAATTGLRLGRA